jgi:hypothetical protein
VVWLGRANEMKEHVKRAIREITFAFCKYCGTRLRLEDGIPVETCCREHPVTDQEVIGEDVGK